MQKGDAPEYLKPLNQLRENYSVRLEVAEVMKQFKFQNIENQFDAELLASNQNYDNEKTILKDTLENELQERIRHLHEDRHTVSFTSSLWAEKNLRRSPRSSHKENSDRKENKVIVDGPYIVYRLKEEDILEDWTVIRRAIQASKQRKNKCAVGASESFNIILTFQYLWC